LSRWRLPGGDRLLSPRGQVLLALALFGLAELLTMPVVVIVLVVLPYRDGPPAIQAAPTLAWVIVAIVLGVPAVCSAYLYVQLRQAVARLPADRRPGRE
jgi:hypothetical protein